MALKNLNNTFDPSQPIHGNLSAYMGFAPIVVNFLNQVACGSWADCREMVQQYGGSDEFADELHHASRQIVRNKNARYEDEVEQGPVEARDIRGSEHAQSVLRGVSLRLDSGS